MSSAWVYQKVDQVQKLGPDKASWYVGWFEPDGRKKGKSFGPGPQGKKNAEKYKRKVEAELMTGTYQANSRKLWADFRKEYLAKIADGMEAETRRLTINALDHFERIVKPVRVFALNAQDIDDFVAARRREPGQKPGSIVSVATVNKELRHLRAVLRVAVDWKYLLASISTEPD